MEAINQNSRLSNKGWRNLMILGVAVPTIVTGIGAAFKDQIMDAYNGIQVSRTIHKNLDALAFASSESPFNDSAAMYIGHADKDLDGDFDSILMYKNPNGQYVALDIEKNPEAKGGVGFPNLDTMAIKPNDRDHPFVGKIAYYNADGDVELESFLMYQNADGRGMPIEVEKLSGGELNFPTILPHSVLPNNPNIGNLKNPVSYDVIEASGKLESVVTAELVPGFVKTFKVGTVGYNTGDIVLQE